MRKFYLFILSGFIAGCLFGQDTKTTQQLTLPLYTQNPTDDVSSPLIPVQKGTQFSLQPNFTVPTKRPFIVKLLKGVGIGVATYQSEKVIEQKSGKYGAAGNNTNWLLPTGIGITVSADKLIPKKSEKTYIQYLLYDRNMQLVTNHLIPIKKTNEPIIITGEAPTDGYLKVQFINTVKNDVTNGSIDINITSPSHSLIVEEKQKLKADIIETDKPNLAVTMPAVIAPSIKTIDELGLVAKPILTTEKQNTITTTYSKKESTVNTITPDENKIIAVPVVDNSFKNRLFTPFAERSPERKSIPVQAPTAPVEAVLPKIIELPVKGSEPEPGNGNNKDLDDDGGDDDDPCSGGGNQTMSVGDDDCGDGGSGGEGESGNTGNGDTSNSGNGINTSLNEDGSLHVQLVDADGNIISEFDLSPGQTFTYNGVTYQLNADGSITAFTDDGIIEVTAPQASKDWINLTSAVIEIAIGLFTIEVFGIGVIVLIDAFYRMSAAINNLLSNYGSDRMAPSIGALIGKALGGYYGEEIGDAIDSLIVLTLTGGPISEAWDLIEIIGGSNPDALIAILRILDFLSGFVDTSEMATLIENWRATH